MARRRTAPARRALDVYVKLHRALNSIQARSNAHFAEHGLSPSQFATLEALYHKGPLCQSEIAAAILRTDGNLTLVVDNLEKAGLVRRRVSEADRRKRVVDLTPAGEARISEAFPGHARNVEALFATLTSAEQEELARLCRKLYRSAS